jgi:predicted secreted hydrolase
MRWARLLLLCASIYACHDPGATGSNSAQDLSIRFLAAGDAQGFTRAIEPRELVFPRDHGSHPEYRTEWWYFTGNLFDANQRHYGFELTFFRIALSPDAVARDSQWATNQVWMAHFAVTDTASGRFVAAERFARGALGLAGASAAPLRVWTEDWSASGSAGGDDAAIRLAARHDGVAIDLRLVAQKGPVAHGDRGLDRKGPEPGNASYYYSLSRLTASGTITTPSGDSAVAGFAWMDREWGTSALSPGVAGWDWFALHLSDGRDLMFYRLRESDGSASPFSGGSLIDAQGSRRALAAQDVDLRVLDLWRSPKSGARYPVRWRLSVPSAQIELEIEPYLHDQEVDLSVRYWEGAVRAIGTAEDEPLSANGYLELAGY